jgi:hypothetical protein
MRATWKIVTSAAVAVGLVGCSSDDVSNGGGDGGPSSNEIRAEDYERSCSAPSDCVLVFEGSPCGCTCANAAIATSAEASYHQRLDELRRACPLTEACAADCADSSATCQDGKCVFLGTSGGGDTDAGDGG